MRGIERQRIFRARVGEDLRTQRALKRVRDSTTVLTTPVSARSSLTALFVRIGSRRFVSFRIQTY
jgi:hypothetical protein